MTPTFLKRCVPFEIEKTIKRTTEAIAYCLFLEQSQNNLELAFNSILKVCLAVSDIRKTTAFENNFLSPTHCDIHTFHPK